MELLAMLIEKVNMLLFHLYIDKIITNMNVDVLKRIFRTPQQVSFSMSHSNNIFLSLQMRDKIDSGIS